MTFDVKQLVLSTIEAAIIGEPRNSQSVIGPSELGMSCEHCLTAKLAGWEQEQDAAWLPYLGTSLHAYLEPTFHGPEWLTERRVVIGTLNGREIPGTADLFHIPSGTLCDHKLVGITTLRKAKKAPSKQYVVQTHSYGLGLVRAGYKVNSVAINYLPRNAVSLRHGHWWQEDFNPLIALDALDNAQRILDRIAGYSDIEERDAWISTLPRDADCFNCGKYPDAPKAVAPPQRP